MGRRARERTAATVELAVTVLGVAGFLGFLLAARMDDANASPFDVVAFAWFFTFGGIKACLPWLLSERAAAKRDPGRWVAGSTLRDGTGHISEGHGQGRPLQDEAVVPGRRRPVGG
jgi:hypothetical protein